MTEERQRLLDQYGEHIIRSTQSFSPAEYQRMAKRFRKIYNPLLPKDKTLKILDVGCGDGHFLYYLKQEGFTNLEGIDSSDERLNLCRSHVIPNVYCADAIQWLESHAEAYDVVVCNHVIEHFPEDALYGFAKALAGAVKKGGQLLITTPNGCSPWAGYNIYHDLTHCRLFTPDSLTQILSFSGLKARLYPEGAVAFDGPSALRWVLWKIREAMIKFDYRIQVGGTRGNQTTPLIVSPNLIAVATKPVASSR